MNIKNNISELVGKTPLLRLNNIERETAVRAKIIAKLEYLNPAGSVKDRIAHAMLDAAENNGEIGPGAVIVEPTSGNTGIGLASAAASRGYRTILVMPETMSVERRKLLAAYGAELYLTEGARGMKGAIEKAEELTREIPGAYMPSQFTNPANPKAHRAATGPEIWADTGGEIDILVAGIGTGGTISGTGEFLRSRNSEIQIIGVEPVDSPILTQGCAGAHGIQGIGAGFIPEVLNRSIYDEIVTISTDEAYNYAKSTARSEGILIGISSAAALAAAVQIAKLPKNENKNIVVIFPDSGERYMSTPLFE